MIELSLFGGFQARLEPGGAIALPTRKSRALLAYLALHPGQAQPRESLAALLWSDRAEPQAHNSLSQALSALRKALDAASPPPLVIGPDSISFDGAAAEVDAVDFERLAAAGEMADLVRAETLYRGDLLAGIGVRDPAFEDWLGFERERLRALAVGALTKLLAYRGERAEHEPLVATAQRLLKLDPLQEAGHRALMRCYLEQGQAGLALRQYQTCAETLKRELGIEPDEETTRLRGEIARQKPVAPAISTPDRTGAATAPQQSRPSIPKWVPALAIAVLAVAGAALWLRPWQARVEPAAMERMAFPLPDRPSIVVLPFANISDDPAQAYFADGMTDDLITDLAKISGLFVISRNSAFTYKGRSIKTGRIAEDLGVRYVLEGSVRRAGNQLRINAQLIDATTGGHLWAERYNGPSSDVFALQDKVTRSIAKALALELMPGEARRIGLSDTANLAAHDAYLLGLSAYYRRTPEDNARATTYFQQAIELDPDYAAAHTALAKAYIRAVIGEQAYAEQLGIHWTDGYTRAWRLLDSGMARPNADVHVLRSWLALNKHQHERAIAEARRAHELNRNDADALEALSEALIFAGQPKAGIEFAERAMRQNPTLLARPFYLMGLAAFALGDPEMAVRHVERAIGLAPGRQADFSGILAASYGALGRAEPAAAAFEAFGRGFLNRPALAWSVGTEAFANPRFHTWSRIGLAWSTYSFPFAERAVLDRLAEGFRRAGASAGVGGYLPLDRTNRLSGPEIRSLLFGHDIRGKDFWLSEFSWRQRRSADGKVEHFGYPVHAGMAESATGLDHIEDGLLCELWPALAESAEICVVVFRVPDPGAQARWGDYVMVTDTGPHPFSRIE